MHRRVVLALGLCAGLMGLGHGRTQPSADRDPVNSQLGSAFRPGETGSIVGRVRWRGAVPNVPPLRYTGLLPGIPRDLPNPNAPRVDRASGAVQQALVFLQSVDLARSRPWGKQVVRVTLGAKELEVREAETRCAIGIVRRGGEVECVSTDKSNRLLVGRGAAFFTLPLHAGGEVTRRRLDRSGWVELSSGAGMYWQRGHLWVSDHPYVTRTAADGTFKLSEVPTGTYDLVCWLPNWHVLRQERNPESGEFERLIYRPAVEKRLECRVTSGETQRREFFWDLPAFESERGASTR